MFKKSKNWQLVMPVWRKISFASFGRGSYILLFIIFISLVFVGRAAINEFNNMVDFQKKINQTSDKISELEKNNAEIAKTIDNFKNDNYLESQARERLNVLRPGEKVIVILPPDGQLKTQTGSKNKIEKALDWFKGKLNIGN